MSFIAAAGTVGMAVGLSGTAATIGGAAIIGAGLGGAYSAITGDGNIGESMLYGGLGGATLGTAGAAMGGGAAATEAGLGASGAAAGEGAAVSGASAMPAAESYFAGATPSSFVPVEGASFTVPGASSAAAVGPTYAELGYTPQMGPTNAELGYAGGNAGNAGGAQASNQIGTESGKQLAKDAITKVPTTQGGLTGTDVMLGTGALMYLTQQENSKYGTPDNAPYSGPLSKFNYDPKNYTALNTAQPNPAYKPVYANYKATPYAGGGIAMANPSVGPVEQMSRANATGNNQMFPQAGVNSPAFANATNRPMGQDIIGSVSDASVDPYSGAQTFAEGGIAATPEAQARPAQSLPSQITQNSINTNDALMARLQGALVSPQVQQSLAQNPLQQTPVRAPAQQFQGYAPPTFTRPDVTATPFAYPQAIPGTTAYNNEQARLAAEEQARQAAIYTTPSDGSSGGGAGGGLMPGALRYAGGGKVSNMEAIDNYIAQYKTEATGPATITAKAKAGDWNAMIALNKIKSTPNQNYAAGGGVGHLGGYAAGGNPRLLKGPGDGMSDNIPATIGDKQPARLADGEFVVPADVVSHLGNGSTDAGAKHLYGMMDKIRKARTGTKKQGKQIKPEKYMPK